MPQFFVPPEQIQNDTATLQGEEAHHLVRALRYRIGDHVWFSDGKGKQYEGKILTATQHQVTLKILQTRHLPERLKSPTLAMALLKQDRWELAVQKVIELGCHHIIPFTSSRTIPHYEEESIEKKLNRWNKIALEAAKQSGLPVQPTIDPPIAWQHLLAQIKQYDRVVMPWEEEKEITLRETLPKLSANTLLIIGPEGGFASEEALQAKTLGVTLVSLGDQILRAETASIVTFTLVQYALKNI